MHLRMNFTSQILLLVLFILLNGMSNGQSTQQRYCNWNQYWEPTLADCIPCHPVCEVSLNVCLEKCREYVRRVKSATERQITTESFIRWETTHESIIILQSNQSWILPAILVLCACIVCTCCAVASVKFKLYRRMKRIETNDTSCGLMADNAEQFQQESVSLNINEDLHSNTHIYSQKCENQLSTRENQASMEKEEKQVYSEMNSQNSIRNIIVHKKSQRKELTGPEEWPSADSLSLSLTINEPSCMTNPVQLVDGTDDPPQLELSIAVTEGSENENLGSLHQHSGHGQGQGHGQVQDYNQSVKIPELGERGYSQSEQQWNLPPPSHHEPVKGLAGNYEGHSAHTSFEHVPEQVHSDLEEQSDHSSVLGDSGMEFGSQSSLCEGAQNVFEQSISIPSDAVSLPPQPIEDAFRVWKDRCPWVWGSGRQRNNVKDIYVYNITREQAKQEVIQETGLREDQFQIRVLDKPPVLVPL